MRGAYWLFFAVLFFSHLLNAVHIFFPRPSLQHYCAIGDWERAEKLFTKKLKKDPHFKWGTSLTMLCMMRAFEDDREFLSTLIAYNKNTMINLPYSTLLESVHKKHYKVFQIVIEKSNDSLSTNLTADLLFILLKDQAPDNIFNAIFDRYQKYYHIHQRFPVSLEQRSKDGFETVLGYTFSHGYLRHARMLLQNGADFVEGILKKDGFGYYLMEKTDWDSAIVGLWCEQDDPLRLLNHHVFKRDKVVGALLIQFFLRAIDSPLFEGFEDIALLFQYRRMLSCLESIGHKSEFDGEEWLCDDNTNSELGLRNRYFFDTVKERIATQSAFLNTMRRFEPCHVQGCPGGSFSMKIYSRGTRHFECEICFRLQCISCGERHPQAQCKTQK